MKLKRLPKVHAFIDRDSASMACQRYADAPFWLLVEHFDALASEAQCKDCARIVAEVRAAGQLLESEHIAEGDE